MMTTEAGVVREDRKKDKHPHMQQRTYRKALDQHGRQWGAEIDGRTNDPITVVQPKFSAPWVPEFKYIHWRYEDASGRYWVEVDYAELKADRRQQMREWTSRLLEVGSAINGQAFDPSNPTPAVLAKVGPKPEPVEIAIRAERDDPWILGLSPDMPEWAVPYFMPADLTEDDLDLQDAEAARAGAPVAPVLDTPRKRGRPRRSAA